MTDESFVLTEKTFQDAIEFFNNPPPPELKTEPIILPPSVLEMLQDYCRKRYPTKDDFFKWMSYLYFYMDNKEPSHEPNQRQ